MTNIKEERYFMILKTDEGEWLLDYTTLIDSRLSKRACTVHKNSTYGRVSFLQDAVSIGEQEEAKRLLEEYPVDTQSRGDT